MFFLGLFFWGLPEAYAQGLNIHTGALEKLYIGILILGRGCTCPFHIYEQWRHVMLVWFPRKRGHSIIETVIQHELERWAQLGPQCEITMSCGFPICRVGDRCLQREVSQTNLVSPTLPIQQDEESTWQRFMHLLILFDPFCPVQLSPTILYSRIIDYAIMQHVTVYMFHDVSQGCLQLCTVPQKCPS